MSEPKTFLAGIVGYECFIGIGKIARISKWINATELETTVNGYFTLLRCGEVDIESLECLKPTRPCPMLSSSIEEVGDGEYQVVGTSW